MNAPTKISNLSRRKFVVGSTLTGVGLAVGITLPLDAVAAAPGSTGGPEIGAWVVIKPDESVIVRIVRSEMGQGTSTGLAQLVAEELECDWGKVSIEFPTPGESLKRKRIWGEFSTGGSRGIRTSEQYVRKGGAAARMMLIDAAAAQWKVPAAECFAAKGVITHKPTGRKTSFGKVSVAASKLPVPTDIVLKDPKDWTIIGKDKVTGKQVYGIDLKFPGMVVATIKECPVFGGKLKSFDDKKAMAMKGVKKVIKVGETAVAVVADTFWHAKSAIAEVQIEWDLGPNASVSSETIKAMLQEGLTAEQAFVGNQRGDIKAALSGAAKKIEATYSYPHLNHATMEPQNATAIFTPERCEAWVPTQDGESSLAVVIATSGLDAEKCELHKVNLGGGFGRRGATQDYTKQAVLIAKQMPGVHVKLIWTREEDMTQGRYHPIMMSKLTASFDDKNNMTGMHMRLSGQSILASLRPAVIEQQKGRDPIAFQGVFDGGEHGFSYTFPNLLIDHAMRNPHVPPGFWRGVNVNQNAIFMECFMDEMAEAAGMDPVEFRRKHMADFPRNLAALNAVVERIEWSKPAPTGIYRGVAQMTAYGSMVAAACEISVEDGTKIKVHRIVAATDCSYAVNPAQIERQVAGSFVYGLSALFLQECTVKNGAIEQKNFDTYDSMRIAQMPKVEAIILQGGGKEWGGVGEPTICVAAPAVLNAYYAATGKRIRTMPLKNSGITMV